MMHYAWVADAIVSGAEIVTASRRLARALRHGYDEQQLLAGREAWRTPCILPWDAWLNRQFDRLPASATLPLRLDAQASTLLWERLLAEAAGERMLSQERLVRQIRLVWRRLHDWCVPLDAVERAASSDDERLFAAAARHYQADLSEHAWIDSAQLAAFIAERVANREMAAPRRLLHAGFDRLTPVAQKLLRVLADHGCVVAAAPLRSAASVPVLLCATDADAELRTAGRWAREQLAANASARIAIIHPALEQDAPRAARLVREGVAPGWQHGSGRHRSAVNVSYGSRLAGYPLVAVALLWLDWLYRGLSSREVSVLLRTPLAAASSSDGRSRLETRLRRMPNRSWSPASLAAALRGRDPADDALAFVLRVERIAAFRAGAPPSAPPAVWAAAFDQLLGELGWPGDRPHDSEEFQLVNRWRELLNEWSRIGVVRPVLGLPEAIARLHRSARETIYQPESGAGQVQLSGTLEAAGLEFDHVWVARLHSLQWPPPAHPLPFLSRGLQRRAGMPDASPADTLEFSRRTLARLVASAPSVVLSWPQADQESALTPSPLLAPWLRAGTTSRPDPGWHAASMGGRVALEHALPDPAPPVLAGEHIQGGAHTVQRQVEEPLSAFAAGRLGARELQAIETGLSPSLRGSVVHRALHLLFRELPTSAGLASWSAAERGRRIDAAIDAALSRPLRHADAVLRRLLALERQRLQGMLASFLEAETARAPFSVAGVETDLAYESRGVRLALRLDRLDQLADGTSLIIDYKTGAPKRLLDRQGELLDLQLVVYACAVRGRIGGLALVNIDSRGISYSGTGSSTEWGTVAPDLWERQLASWQDAAHRAMAEIAAGDVRIDLTPSAGRRRTFDVLSRIEELKRAP